MHEMAIAEGILDIALDYAKQNNAKKINEIGNELAEKKVINSYKKMKEVNGHTPMEVLCGCLLGFFVGLSFCLLK